MREDVLKRNRRPQLLSAATLMRQSSAVDSGMSRSVLSPRSSSGESFFGQTSLYNMNMKHRVSVLMLPTDDRGNNAVAKANKSAH